MKPLLPAVILALLAVPAAAADKAEAAACLDQAAATETRALAAQAAWTSTEALLAEARKALAAGQWDTTCDLAQEALAQARRSLEQAEEQKAHWRDAVLH